MDISRSSVTASDDTIRMSDGSLRRSERLRKLPSWPPPLEESTNPKKDTEFNWKLGEKKALNVALQSHGPDDLMQLQRCVPSRNTQEIQAKLEMYKGVARGTQAGYDVNREANLNKWISALNEIYTHHKASPSLSCSVNVVMRRKKRKPDSGNGSSLMKLMQSILKQEVPAEAFRDMKPCEARYILRIMNDIEKDANLVRHIVHSDPFFQMEGDSEATGSTKEAEVSRADPRWKPYHSRTIHFSTINPLGISEKTLKAVNRISSGSAS